MGQYLDLELTEYKKKGIYPFHMPGHKRQKLGEWTPEEIDITEIEGFDNLHHAQGILKEAQERIARLSGADHSFLLVNGSTAGILAAICGSVKKGGRLLIGRNAHKSVYHAAYLMEVQMEYLYPQPTAFGIQGSIVSEQVEDKLDQFPDTGAVVITSPTYDGVVSDIRAIADIVHAHKIPLIVDEAHGAHFGFSQEFPQKALTLGADICIESLHKTLPAYTQSAVLHVMDHGYVDLERIKRYLGIYQSSSPSYVLMAGMDRCARILQQEGTRLFEAFGEQLRRFYAACENLKKIEVFPYYNSDPGIWEKDISKILICAEAAGLNGQQLYDLLLERYGLQMEMASGHYVTALTTIMDTQDGFDRLLAALVEIDRTKNRLTDKKDNSEKQEQSSAEDADTRITPKEIYRPAIKRMELYQAMDAPKYSMDLMEAGGCICGEFIYLYPPGIPLAAPGEEITSQMLQVIECCRQRSMQIQGMADSEAKKLQVVFTTP